MGDQSPLVRHVHHGHAPCCRRMVVYPSRPQRGPSLHSQDHDRSGAMAGRNDFRHPSSSHRKDREETPGDAVCGANPQLYDPRAGDDRGHSQGLCFAKKRSGNLASGAQEGRRYSPDAAARGHRTPLQRRVRRHVLDDLRLHGRRLHAPRAARLRRERSLPPALGAGCQQGRCHRGARRTPLFGGLGAADIRPCHRSLRAGACPAGAKRGRAGRRRANGQGRYSACGFPADLRPRKTCGA